MAQDKREEILVRLEAILTTLATDGIRVYRDRAEFDHEELPAYILLDGTESTAIRNSTDRRAPQIMTLLPQIFFVPQPTENALNVNVGPHLSAMRVAMIKAITRDEPLQMLLGDNGYTEYRGMETDMQTGAEVKGQIRFDFAFAYVLNFKQL